MSKKLDISNQKFNSLIALRSVGKNKYGCYLWACSCDCGGEIIARSTDIKSGLKKSCGCLHGKPVGEKFNGTAEERKKLYQMWRNMINRCFNPLIKSYKDYGGRGISVCKEWKKSFGVFANFIINKGWRVSDNLQIDRIDNNGNYEPSNIKFSTRSINCHNKRQPITHRNKYIGVHFHRVTGKFAAEISVNKIRTWLGVFKTEENAVRARNQFILKNDFRHIKIQAYLSVL